jgi:hypothetical protein
LLSKLNSWSKYATAGGTCAAVCMLGALSMTAPAKAGKYAYGERFVLAGETWSDGAPAPVSAQLASSSAQDNVEFQRQVALLEEQGGPYSDALAEPLEGLGRHYRQNGDLAQALVLYRRALHVVRVNDGLYSERQMPILRELLGVYRDSGEVQALDDRYDYYFRLYGRGQPPYTEVRLRAALAYLRWQREAIRLGIDKEESHRLLDLYNLNEKILGAIATDTSVALHWQRDLVLSQLRNLYLVEDRFAPTVENQGPAAPTPFLGNDLSQQNLDKNRLETMQRGSEARGSELMLALIERTAEAGDTDELASLHLELGDWYQWHGSERQAGEQYQQVVKLLSAAQRPDLLQQWLGQPRELPDNGAFWQPRPESESQPPVVINVSYDVSAKGRVRNVQSEVSGPADEGLAKRLQRKLRQIRFRPRWDGGVAEPVTQIKRGYVLID